MTDEQNIIGPSANILSYMNLVDKYQTRLIGEGKSDKTKDEYSRVLKRLLEVYPDPFAMVEEDVLAFRDRLAIKIKDGKPTDPNTMIVYVAAINSIMEFLGKKVYVKPPRPSRKLVKPLTVEEVNAIFRMAGNNPSTFHARRDRAIVMVMTEMAQRRTGVADIRLEDFDPSRGVIIVRAYKRDDDRSIPIPPGVVQAVSAYLEVRGIGKTPEDEEYLFLTKEGVHISVKTVADIVKRSAARAGITRRVHSQLLKHTKLTQLGETGMNEFQLMRFSGHKNPQNLARYVHPHDELVHKVVLANPMITTGTDAPKDTGPSNDDIRRRLLVRLSTGELDAETYKLALEQLGGGAKGMGA